MKKISKRTIIYFLLCVVVLPFAWPLIEKYGAPWGSSSTTYRYKPFESFDEYIAELPSGIIGGLVVFIVLYFWDIRFSNKNEIKIEPRYCIHCKKTIAENFSNNYGCPSCGKETEPLKGVFERHPELKKNA